ncbi:uncharacterized protein [Dermacentor andersoni]|uniref:uncharacterized protein n=1 Tax=Dermacentor andersoni TaxID=34620 RepID=UPI003B3A5894
MDEPITENEMKAVIAATTGYTAAGTDRITNPMIRNLSDKSISALTTFLNQHWEQGLSTQDVLLQNKEKVLSNVSRSGEYVLLAIDIKGAFDNVSHQGILEGLANTNCAERTYKYVQSFLNHRTAELKMGEIQTPVYQPPNKGTPQGAAI